jgi:hypothetical protein
MDEIDKAQLKLEGRCIHCKEKLPNHLTDCELHPRHDVLKGIKGISFHLNKALSNIAYHADDDEKRKQIEEIIAKIKK